MGEFDMQGLFEHISKYLEKLVKMIYQTFFWFKNPGEPNTDWEDKDIA